MHISLCKISAYIAPKRSYSLCNSTCPVMGSWIQFKKVLKPRHFTNLCVHFKPLTHFKGLVPTSKSLPNKSQLCLILLALLRRGTSVFLFARLGFFEEENYKAIRNPFEVHPGNIYSINIYDSYWLSARSQALLQQLLSSARGGRRGLKGRGQGGNALVKEQGRIGRAWKGVLRAWEELREIKGGRRRGHGPDCTGELETQKGGLRYKGA